jgi:RNA polymerase sigma-70 factor (ECF subfamily)
MAIPFEPATVAGTEGHEVADTDASFEVFFEDTHQRLFGGLCLVTGNRHEAEEVMQNAYLKLWERWDRVSLMADPAGFLFRTAINQVRSRYRRTVLALKRTVSLAASTTSQRSRIATRSCESSARSVPPSGPRSCSPRCSASPRRRRLGSSG